MWVNWHKTEGRTWVTVFVTDSLEANPLRWSGGFLSRNPFKLCPVKLSSLCCFLHSAFNTSSWQLKNAALFRHLLTFLSLLISLHEWMTLHMGGYVFDDCIHHSLCVCVCLRISSISGLKKNGVQQGELGSPILSTALLHVQLHSSSNREQNSPQVQSQ